MIQESSPRITEKTVIGSPNFLVFVQGAWGAGNNDLNIAASKEIIKEKIASTLLYESFRDWAYLESWPSDKKMEHDDWKKAFDEKTYFNELEEFRQIVDYVNREHNPQNLFVSGRSYGGGLVTLISGEEIPNLKRILLISPQIACSEEAKQDNIYQGFPPIEEFLNAISRYKGKLHILHGEYDGIVPVKQSELLLDAATTNEKHLSKVAADHSFSGKAQEKYVQAHLEALG